MNYLYKIFRKEQENRKEDNVIIRYEEKNNLLSYNLKGEDEQINVKFCTIAFNDEMIKTEVFSLKNNFNEEVELAQLWNNGKYAMLMNDRVQNLKPNIKKMFTRIFNDYANNREKIGIDNLPQEFYKMKSKNNSLER